MYKKLLFTLLIGIISHSLIAQVSFTDETSSLNDTTLKSGVAMAVVDMNNDGLDDVVRLSGSSNLRIEFQQPDGSFVKLTIGNVGSAWAIAIADVDGNGYNDIIAGGAYNGLDLALANGTGTAYTLSTLSGPSIFSQNANFVDMDNNGTIDYFVCHDDGISSAYNNNGSGSFTYDLGLINAVSTVPSDNSGNYGSIWMDYDNDGDLDMYLSKCRLGVGDTGDGRRRNMLFQNDGSNNFTDVASAAGLLPLGQTWATNFEDIDNDGDLDVVMINHDVTCQIYLNNGNGTFTDITAISGIATELSGAGIGLGIQVMMEDFDNDGYIDIFLTGRSGVHYLFTNDGDNTFTTVSAPFPGSPAGIQSGALGDLNNDGFIDILAGHATGFNSPSGSNSDQLFINTGNSNNWVKVILEGVASNDNGVGARLEAYGAWGKQIREVRAGESYGTQNSFASHFGIAGATSIDRIVIKWPSGNIDILENPAINGTITASEASNGTCTAITTWSGSWSNGAPTSSTHVIISSNYNTSSGSIDACSLVIDSGATLTVAAGDYVNVENNITVDGTLDVLHEGSVIQVSNNSSVANNGTITVRKITPSLDSRAFMIISSPMTSELRSGVFGNSIMVRNHVTANFVPHPGVGAAFPLTENFADNNGDDWIAYSGLINPGEGYLVRPYPTNTSSGIFNLDFTLGTLNNGTVTYPVTYNGTQNASANILGNPYASAIDTDAFMAANSMIDAVYFWEHLTPASGAYPGYNVFNYDMGDISSYNAGSGGVAAANGGAIPSQFMSSGQGFGVKASAGGTAVFNNSMRVTGPNDTFRNTETTLVERDRIWLDIKNETFNLGSNMLVAFVEGATDGYESYYDTKRMGTPVSLFSILKAGNELSIQGRTAFDVNQEVKLGFSTMVEGKQKYTISIRQLEGLNITGVDVYIEDSLLKTHTNLSEENYSFIADQGTQVNRFSLVFKKKSIQLKDFVSATIKLTPNPTNGLFTIVSLDEQINKVEVFDVQGRIVVTKTFSINDVYEVDLTGLDTAMYFVKIFSPEGIITKRVLKQ